MFAFVLLSIVASAIASDGHVHVNSGCPDVKPVDNFNLAAFATGKWYEAARYPNSIEEGGNCGWADYSLTGDTFSVKNYDVSKGKLRSVEGSARLADDARTTGKLIFSYPYGADGAITKSTLWVLGTDYDNYAVLYYCKFDEETKTRQDFNWVFSRSKSFVAVAKAAVDQILKDNTFLDSTKLIWPDFSDEACRSNVAQ
ncbi:bilin-binding protein-like [Maniola hyperantus]|uniref:bilin-binding protein-like n=1 Tax=Aphantopus hyperantus TaxID=2795564 RepID=UPI001568C951|nr:bilin-binding protein-like [Maniola hyperantus]